MRRALTHCPVPCAQAGGAPRAPHPPLNAAPKRRRFIYTVACPDGVAFTSPDPVAFPTVGEPGTADGPVPLTFGPEATGAGTFNTNTITEPVNCTVFLRVAYEQDAEDVEAYGGIPQAFSSAAELQIT